MRSKHAFGGCHNGTSVFSRYYQWVFLTFCRKARLLHVRIDSQDEKRVIDGIYHIQNVNAFLSRYRQWEDRFNGISTKYTTITMLGLIFLIKLPILRFESVFSSCYWILQVIPWKFPVSVSQIISIQGFKPFVLDINNCLRQSLIERNGSGCRPSNLQKRPGSLKIAPESKIGGKPGLGPNGCSKPADVQMVETYKPIFIPTTNE